MLFMNPKSILARLVIPETSLEIVPVLILFRGKFLKDDKCIVI